MSYYDDHFLVPDFENEKVSRLTPLADFIATRLMGLSKSLKTAEDDRERDEILCDISLCNASLSLLNFAYLTESDQPMAAAKELMRSV